MAAQFQGVALKGLGVGAPGVGKTDFGLSHHPAGRAKEAFDSQRYQYRLQADGQGTELADDFSLLSLPGWPRSRYNSVQTGFGES